ncbi:MAG: hypothetical protein HY927_10550 [Elusimicrobia bacterium]|nr:hypothetical protein [Elusimicrobiota bacterium]
MMKAMRDAVWWDRLLVAAGLLFLWTAVLQPQLASWEADSHEHRWEHYADTGEALLHGVPPPGDWIMESMPLASILPALLFEHGGGQRRRAGESLPGILVPLLVFAFGALNGSLLAGLAGALLYQAAVLGHLEDLWKYPYPFHAVSVVLVACLLAWRARSPTTPRSVLLGLGIGVSILYRSPLVFFPPVLALYEVAVVHGGSLRRAWRPLLPVVALPYLLLVPVLFLKLAVSGGLAVLEGGSIYGNAVGASGAVSRGAYGGAYDGIIYAQEGDVEPVDTFSGWAAAVSRQPGRFGRTVLERAAFVVSLEPLLFALGLLALWLHRGRRELWPPALLIGYFVGVHCPLMVRSSYMAPVWPVLAGLAGHALVLDARRRVPETAWPKGARSSQARAVFPSPETALRWVALLTALAGSAWGEPRLAWLMAAALSLLAGRRGAVEAGGRGEGAAVRVGGWVTLAVLVPALALASYGLVRVGVYASLARAGTLDKPGRLDDAVRAAPDDAWLLARRAVSMVEAGAFEAAAGDYERAVALRPDREDWRLDLAWARMLAGRPGPLLSYEPAWSALGFRTEGRVWLGIRLHLARAAAFLRAGAARRSKAELMAAFEAWHKNFMDVEAGTIRGGSVSRKVFSRGFLIPAFAEEFVSQGCRPMLTVADRAALLAQLVEVLPGDKRLGLMRAQAALEAGQRRTAADALAEVDPASIGRLEAQKALELCRALGGLPRLSAMTKGLLDRFPGDAPLHVEAALCAAAGGGKASARLHLAVAEEGHPAPSLMVGIAELYGKLGERGRAVSVMERIVRGDGAGLGAADWVGLARGAQAAGEGRLALEALSRADIGALPAQERAAAAGLFSGLGEPGRAAAVARAMVREGSGLLSAARWLDLAGSALMAGAKDVAAQALRRAEGARPSDGETARIALLHLELGDGRRALSLARPLVESGAAAQRAGEWLALARGLAGAGDKGLLLKALARAQEARPSVRERLEILRLRQGLGDARRDRDIVRGLVREGVPVLTAGEWVDLARLSAEAGERESAKEALARGRARGMGVGESLKAMKTLAAMGEERGALAEARRLLERVRAGGGKDVGAPDWLEAARIGAKAGDASVVREALGRAESAPPGAQEAWVQVEMARLFWDIKERGRALAAAAGAAQRGGQGPTAGQWVGLARVAGEAGDKGLAKRCLELAEKAGPKAEELRALAMGYQGLEDYRKALGILDRLVESSPGALADRGAAWGGSPRGRASRPPLGDVLADRGVLKWLMGDVQGAIADLRGARRLEPGNLETALSLGSALEAAGRAEEAARVYDEALTAAGTRAEPAMLRRVRREQERLAAKMKGR